MNTGYLSDALLHLYYYRFSFCFCSNCELWSPFEAHCFVTVGEWRNRLISILFRFISISAYWALNAIRNQFTLSLISLVPIRKPTTNTRFILFFFFSAHFSWMMNDELRVMNTEYLKAMEFIKMLILIYLILFSNFEQTETKQKNKNVQISIWRHYKCFIILHVRKKKKTKQKLYKENGKEDANHSIWFFCASTNWFFSFFFFTNNKATN